jgi:hypothetical protein
MKKIRCEIYMVTERRPILSDLGFAFLAETENRLPVCVVDMPPSANKVLRGDDYEEEQ